MRRPWRKGDYVWNEYLGFNTVLRRRKSRVFFVRPNGAMGAIEPWYLKAAYPTFLGPKVDP
jgi:hypothetical protein